MSILWLIFGYFAGSCPTGYLAVKILKGQDVRDLGSGNICATNTGRVLGKKWAIAVAVFDMLKGGIAVLLASLFTESGTILALTGVFSVLGHNYPVWLGWRTAFHYVDKWRYWIMGAIIAAEVIVLIWLASVFV